VDLHLPTAGLDRYKSPSQRARVSTEAWGEANLFCANCDSPELTRTRTNTPAIDFTCPNCDSVFQLKSQGRKLCGSLTDGAYGKMSEAILADKTPNLFALHYEPEHWKVRNLLLVPKFSYSLSVIRKRNPLKPQAERHDWVGCTILLGEIPQEAKIPIICDGEVASAEHVRKRYLRLKKLGVLTVEARGWTLDVLRAIHALGKSEFSLEELYASEDSLARLHPDNRHIQPKIRQQLQVLRDMGFVKFLGSGYYRLR
jgi:type II restriction enzyme